MDYVEVLGRNGGEDLHDGDLCALDMVVVVVDDPLGGEVSSDDLPCVGPFVWRLLHKKVRYMIGVFERKQDKEKEYLFF